MAVEDISAVAKIDPFLVIGSDEGVGAAGNENYIQLLKKKDDDGGYILHNNILLQLGDESEGNELDIEGIGVEENRIYVIGAHCRKRKKVKSTRSHKKNRKKFQYDKIEEEKNRDWLYQVTIDTDGNALDKQRITLRDIIKNDPVLHLFTPIPSKENGVDIEGIAAKDGWVYIGFRGPVFRENYVPVMKLKFDDPEKTYNLLYVELGGRGIRDIVSVSDGFLLLAGPVGDGSDSYQLYHWDGKDVIPGEDLKEEEEGKIRLLGEIVPPLGGKVEGVVVLEEQDSFYQLIIAYDGAADKESVMQHFRITTQP
ncbi:MAG: DUF3616 domain-containing protein [Candidatus Electrothrix sp. AR4]|nr:DUF3616 domain-containing protein [Candidatus Electrothrix sp. AR4]